MSGFVPTLAAAALLTLVLVAPGAAQQTRVRLSPGMAKLGERVVYRAEVIHDQVATVRWFPPDTSANLSWGAPRVGRLKGTTRTRRFGSEARRPGRAGAIMDTTWIEIPLQAFELGVVAVAGVRFDFRSAPDQSSFPTRTPTSRLVVVPVLAAADSDATLRGLHGPMRAPWWERVPWTLVAIVLVLIAILVAAWILWRRRRREAPAAIPVAAPTAAAAALLALAELRALGLPAQGRFAEHAFRLGQILRRYLEATVSSRPGDSTPELVRHLREAGLPAEDQQRLAALLRVWDRIKFAREPFSVEEAERTEQAVESFLRQGDRPVSAAA